MDPRTSGEVHVEPREPIGPIQEGSAQTSSQIQPLRHSKELSIEESAVQPPGHSTRVSFSQRVSPLGPEHVEGHINVHSTARSEGESLHSTLHSRPRTSDMGRRIALSTTEEHWVFPTIRERLEPTLEEAQKHRNKLRLKARSAIWSMNIVTAIQVFLGALTTGISAASLNGQKVDIRVQIHIYGMYSQQGAATAALGILSTLSGSFLGQIRATNEPEKSLMRAHKLGSFLRDCEAFCLDHGHDITEEHNGQIDEFRHRLGAILDEVPLVKITPKQTPGADGPIPLPTKEPQV